MRSLLLLACIALLSLGFPSHSHVTVTALETEESFTQTVAALASIAPPTSGYMDIWTRGIQGCERVAGPISFIPGACLYIPFLSSFSSTYFQAPQPDGYAIVYYSNDNTTAFLYAYEDETCQKYANWSYSTPLATQQCGSYAGPNIWPSSSSLGPPAPAWPADQFTAPIGLNYQTDPCSTFNANGLTLGHCYAAGTSSPVAVFCGAAKGSWVTFVQYAPGSNCEPEYAIGTKLLATGCNSVQQSDYTCPDVTGPTAPTITGGCVTLTSFISSDVCRGAIVSTETYKQEVCVENTMFNCNQNNGTYWKYTFTGNGCQKLVTSQIYPIGCYSGTSTFVQCSKSEASAAALQSLFDSPAKAPTKPDTSPQIAEF